MYHRPMQVTFAQFAEARLTSLLRYAVMLTGDPHLAADLVQETMLRIQTKWERVSEAGSPEAYVRRMLTNAFIDARRTSWWQRVILRESFSDDARTPRSPDHAGTHADRDELWRHMARLPRRQRAALVLRYYENYSDSEIADVLDCSVATVRSSIVRALATMQGDMSATRSMTGGNRDRG